MKKASMALVCASIGFVFCAEAFAFADDDARQAILDLRERFATMQSAQLQLSSQLDELRDQNATLMGRVEKLANELSMQQRSARDLFANVDKRVAACESQTQKSEDGKVFTVLPDEKRRYDLGLQLFAEGNYSASCRLLESLIEVYPKTGYMPTALYWIGCGQFAMNRMSDSIRTQGQLIRTFPTSSRVPEAMLSKAAAEASIGRKAEARSTLQQLIKKYPKTETAKLAQQRLRALHTTTPVAKPAPASTPASQGKK